MDMSLLCTCLTKQQVGGLKTIKQTNSAFDEQRLRPDRKTIKHDLMQSQTDQIQPLSNQILPEGGFGFGLAVFESLATYLLMFDGFCA